MTRDELAGARGNVFSFRGLWRGRREVFAAERIHAYDTTVPVLAKGKTRTGRLWTYVRAA